MVYFDLICVWYSSTHRYTHTHTCGLTNKEEDDLDFPQLFIYLCHFET